MPDFTVCGWASFEGYGRTDPKRETSGRCGVLDLFGSHGILVLFLDLLYDFGWLTAPVRPFLMLPRRTWRKGPSKPVHELSLTPAAVAGTSSFYQGSRTNPWDGLDPSPSEWPQ